MAQLAQSDKQNAPKRHKLTNFHMSPLFRKLSGLMLACVGLVAQRGQAASAKIISVQSDSLPIPAGGGGDSEAGIISADGRYVLFESMAANLVVISNPAPVSGLLARRLNVFRRDRVAGVTTLVSANLTNKGGGNGDSFGGGISTNGQIALFVSSAGNLVSNDTNNATDVFLRNLSTTTNTLISVRTNGGVGNGASRNAAMTPEGRYVAFVSAANNLVAGDTNGIPDVFVRDRVAGTTVLVSVGAKSTGSASVPSGSSESPLITPNGRYVAFYSSATNLVSGITNIGEVYVRDLIAGTTTMASTNARAILQSVTGSSSGHSCNYQISDNGQFVAFVIGTNAFTTAYSRGVALRHDLQTGNTDIIHTNANVPFQTYSDIRNLCMTADGRFVTFIANTNVGGSALCVYQWDAQTATTTLISGNTNNTVAAGTFCDWPQMDASGRYVAFFCSAPSLVTNTLSGGLHLYLRDTQVGTTQLINAGTNDVAYETSVTTAPSLSADGQVIVFDARDGGLATKDNNGAMDVFARNVSTGTTELISARHASLSALTPNGASGLGLLPVSSDGRFVAFTSDAENIVTNDTNGLRDVFVRDLFLGTNILISAATNGMSANRHSTDVAISGDGRYVAFTSQANNIVAGDTNNFSDVFVCDLQTGAKSLVSVKTNNNASGDSQRPFISNDGRYITFSSSSLNLTTNAITGFANLFQRDMQTGITRALTTGGVINWYGTPDGSRMAFVGRIPGDGIDRVYVWNSATATRIYTNILYPVLQVCISANGQRLAYWGGSPYSLYMADLVSNTTVVVSTGVVASKLGLKLSADGRYLPYSTTVAKFNDSNGTNDVWLYDFQTSTNIQVCRAYNSVLTPNGPSDTPDISPDGRFIAYRSLASNAVTNDVNAVADLLLFDRLSGSTYPLTKSAAGNFTANNFSLWAAFSGDSRTLVLSTWASDLLARDFNTGSDLVGLSLATSAIKDSDGDNMDDVWETNHFGNLSHTGSADSDGDGASDLSEFQNLSNPTNQNSSFRAEIAVGTNPNLTWPAMPWRSYRAQYRDEITAGNWQDLNSSLTLLGTNAAATDPLPATDQRFYRILLTP